MKCIQCGAELMEDSKFCAVCGKPVQRTSENMSAPYAASPVITPAAPQPERDIPASPQPVMYSSNPQPGTPESDTSAAKKKSSKKTLVIALIAIAAAAILAIGGFLIIRNLFGTSTGGSYPQSSYLLVVGGEDEVQIYAGDKEPVTVDGLLKDYEYSMDGKSIAFSVDADEEGLAALLYCDGKEAMEVADSVYSYSMAASAGKIVYLADYDDEDCAGDLYLYDIKSDKSELIAEEAFFEFALSPDGKSIAYTTDVSMDEYGYIDGFTGYISINGDAAEELGENLSAFAISNGGDYIYYVEIDMESTETGDLYIRHGDTDDKLGAAELYNGFFLNSDYSEILFDKGGSTYICVDGGEKEKISSLSLDTIITPSKTQYSRSYSNYLYAGFINISTFTDQLFALSDEDDGGTTLAHVDSKLEVTEIEDMDDSFYMYSFTLSANGKSLYFINDSGKIVYYKDYRDFDADPVKFEADDDVANFIVMPDQKTVYFVDMYQTLWVVRGTSEPEEIAEDVEEYSFYPSQDGKGIYYIADFEAESDVDSYAGGGTLYYIANEEDADSEEIAEGVYSIEVTEYGTVYYVYDHADEESYSYIGEAFFSLEGNDFTSIMDNAMMG